MAAHRYWRVSVTNVTTPGAASYYGGNPQVVIGEIELRTSPSGADIATGGTAAASTDNGTFDASGGFDGATSNPWAAADASGFPQWISYDLGLGNDADVRELAMWSDDSDTPLAPKDFTIEYSDDNSSWTVDKTYIGEVLSSYTEYTYAVGSGAITHDVTITEAVEAAEVYGTTWPGGHRYWRIVINEYQGGAYVELRDLIINEGDPAVPSVNLLGTASASIEDVAFEAANALNGPSGAWRVTSPSMPVWWKYDFGSSDWRFPSLFTAFTSPGFAATNLQIEYSDDDTNWEVSSYHIQELVSLTLQAYPNTPLYHLIMSPDSIGVTGYFPTAFTGVIEDLINTLDSVEADRVFIKTVLENVEASSNLLFEYIVYIVETLNIQDTEESSAVLSKLVEENLTVEAIVRLTFFLNAIENIDTLDSTNISKKLFQLLDEDIALNEVLTSLLEANGTGVVEGIEVAGLSNYGFLALILESIDVSSSVLSKLIATTLVEEGIDVSDVLITQLLVSLTAEETLDILAGASTSAVLSSKLEEYITFTLDGGDGESYYGWTYNPENSAVTNYNLNFSELASYQSNTYLANTSGLYLLEGNKDEDAYIQSKITTAGLTFGKRTEKQVPQVFLGVGGDNHIISVSVDEQETVYYELSSNPDDGLITKNLKIGKGLIGNTWQFSLTDKNQLDFDLDSLEFYPVFLKRKHR